jgi:hypothetical protein
LTSSVFAQIHKVKCVIKLALWWQEATTGKMELYLIKKEKGGVNRDVSPNK